MLLDILVSVAWAITQLGPAPLIALSTSLFVLYAMLSKR